MIDLTICERGNNAFRNDEGSAVLFAELDIKGKYLQAAFNPMNYPSWEIGTVYLYEEELTDHINDNLGGWHVDKCQLPINIDKYGYVIASDDIVSDVVEHVMKSAADGDYDPTQTNDALQSAIYDSASVLEYTLTKKLANQCFIEIMDNI